MKKSIVLSGLLTSRKKAEARQDVNNFFETEMDLEIEIEDLFFLNKTSTTPMVIMLKDLSDKDLIFKNVWKLKGLVM